MTPEPQSTSAADPRLAQGTEQDVRPMVERPRAGLSGVVIAGMAGIGALALFATLEARRQAASAPATMMAGTGTGVAAAPPPLYIPPDPPPPVVPLAPASGVVSPVPQPSSPPTAVVVPDTGERATVPQGPPSPASGPESRGARGQAVIVDRSNDSASSAPDGGSENAKMAVGTRGGLSMTRTRAAMFANRSTTVPQGTLIPAVLETAFDSTSPGFARALVQKDIYGFDGTRILIPRGSRLIGEYGEDVKSGQRRAVILWTRLIRPDGVTIAIASPAADTLGRGGMKADVNTHFLERFSGAILQSALNVGVALAGRNSSSSVIVALPNSASSLTSTSSSATNGTNIAPTLRVPAGRSVSVFVARDLDFTGSDAVR